MSKEHDMNLCQKCGNEIEVGKWKLELVKYVSPKRKDGKRHVWYDDTVILCEECASEFEEWLAEG